MVQKTRRIGILLLLCVATTRPGASQDIQIERDYVIQFGAHPTLEAGAVSAIGLSSLIFDQAGRFIAEEIDTKGFGVAARLANWTLLQVYLGGFLYGTVLHEYLGHYSRAREFGIAMDVHLNFPALGGDDLFLVDHTVPALQRQMIVAGGPDVTALLAYKAVQGLYGDAYSPSYIGHYMLAGKVIDGLFYVRNDVSSFIDDANRYYRDNASYFSGNPVPDDPLSYLLALTESYGFYDEIIDQNATWVQRQEDMSVYTQNAFIHDQHERMKKVFLRAALDPALLYFLYGTYRYLAEGRRFFQPFMLRIKRVAFMPSIRAGYGELGAENYVDLFFRVQGYPPFSIYYRGGGNMFDTIRGAGLEARRIRYKQLILDGQIDYWHNSRDATHNYHAYAGVGYAVQGSRFVIRSGIGYKSKGVLMGKPLEEGVYAYVGGGWTIDYSN